jgi:hypothetical protein
MHQNLLGPLVGRHTNRDRVHACRDQSRNSGTFGEDQGQRARPKAVYERLRRFGDVAYQFMKLIQTANMHDEWIIRGPSFGFKNPGNRSLIECIRPEPINRLGRKSDQLANG